MPAAGEAGAAAPAGTMGALYTGRGPVCGITTRRIGGAGAAGAAGACSAARCDGRCAGAADESAAAAIGSPEGTPRSGAAVATASTAGASETGGAADSATGAGAVVSTVSAGAGATATGGAAAFAAAGFVCVVACSVGRGCVAVGTTAAGGFAATTPDGGTTVTTGRPDAADAGALATTGPTGGRDAIAGVEGGMIEGAGRACGTIFRGSGRAGAAGGAATETTGGAGLAGVFGAVGAAARAGALPLRLSVSSSCFLARMAFITSPGLETWERSILGVMDWEARELAELPWPAAFDPRSKCARTLSASWSSIELEWVLPSPRPSSPNTSRI